METKKRGSAILLILIVITVIGTLAVSALKINGLISQLVIERAEYQKKRAALDALAFYGIALGYSRFKEADNATELISKSFESWPPGQKQYQGLVTVTPQKKQWLVIAQLGQSGRLADMITAQVLPTPDGWQIAGWEYTLK